jgi:prepilin-type processing-associated H-X9-DG protein
MEMDEHLVGYLLDALDPDTQRQIEAELRDDPGARDRLEELRELLSPLAADRDAFEPPRDLVARTVGRVAEYACRGASDRVTTPDPVPVTVVSPPLAELLCDLSAKSDRAASRPPSWRRPDLVVAASLAVLLGGVLLASVPYIRAQQQVRVCSNTMRQLHQALVAYADQNAGQLPQVQEKEPDNRADCYGPILREAGLLPADVRAACPAARPGPSPVSFAYTLGYRGDEGQLLGLRLDEDAPGPDHLPVLADRPSLDGPARGNTPDHFRGQNVLFVGGHVRFCTDPRAGFGGDDIYVNRNGQVAAGIGRLDTVLGVGLDQP